jgi:hypothetical protein
LQEAARRHGAKAWTDQDLLDYFDNRKKAPPQQASDDEKTSPTPEESKRWLSEFKDMESDPDLKELFDQDRFDEKS